MSFLTGLPDFSGTIYEDQSVESHNLQKAREYIVNEIKNIYPAWLDNPQGLLGEYWNRDDAYAACYLIWIASMIAYINNNITQNSIIRLQDKFKQLLCLNQLSEFTEQLTELEVAWSLASKVSPLLIEPLVSKEAYMSGERPPGPDFLFWLPEKKPNEKKERVFTEVTVWGSEILNQWDKAASQILSIIQNRLMEQGKALKLQLQLPLKKFDQKQIKQMVDKAWRKISSSTGPDQLTLMDKGIIQWSPYPINLVSNLPFHPVSEFTSPSVTTSNNTDILIHVQFPPTPSSFVAIGTSGVFHSPDVLVDRAVMKVSDVLLLSTEDIQTANELLVRSFRKKLMHKREQFAEEAPYILIIEPGHFRILNEGLINMIEQRIWANPIYNWITGIVLFTSRNGFSSHDPGSQGMFTLNPNAKYLASEALVSAFEGKAKFLWPTFPE